MTAPNRRSHRRILIVDDEPTLAGAMAFALDEHEVEVARGGREALALLRASHFDVVITDVHLPEMSGIQLHDAIAQCDADLARRFVFATGGCSLETQARIEAAGRRCLTKPFDLDELRRAIEEAAGKTEVPEVPS